jgi:uncharacterized protein with PQ loop repeat
MLTATEFAGFVGAGLAGAAYIPQISHLIRARCSAGISRLAFAVWLLASLLITAHAIAIHAGVFIVLGGIQIVATALIMFYATRYKNTLCPIHHPRQPGAKTATGTGIPANEPDSWSPAGRSIAESSTFQDSCGEQRPSRGLAGFLWDSQKLLTRLAEPSRDSPVPNFQMLMISPGVTQSYGPVYPPGR